ncbi:MAG TPA: patatin-like phospholipase family protein [Anaerovoracaceae bacterium]|nr:patatin-like phospholipase family protein [Anaerovoracaceae bacterium]
MKTDAIFAGGGVRGIAFAGAVSCLEDRGYEFQRLAGTSAGAIMAALLAAGYTGAEMSMMMDTDFSLFLDKNALQSVPVVGIPLALLEKKGLYRGDYIKEWVGGLLAAKGKTKFGDLMFEGESRLKIIASDITKRKILILPDDLPQYGIDPMEFELAEAVRMSTAIPLFYEPVVIKYNRCESYIVDGGVLSSFPVWIFDAEGTPRWPTFGFKLVDSSESNCSHGKKDLLSYIFDIFDAMINVDQTAFMRDKDSVRTISIPTLGIRTTDFDISPMDAFRLFRSGYESTSRFLKQWDFRSYVGKYRNSAPQTAGSKW